MSCHVKLNNVEYRQIKRNKLFGLDRKCQFKTNNYLFFICLCRIVQKNVKMAHILPKNVPKCPLFDSIQQYSAVFDNI